MTITLSVILCSYNPDRNIFEEVVTSLKNQTLPYNYWELLVIDNNSSEAISNWLDLSWHPNARIILENKIGLINARNRGTIEAQYEYLISVDDDTALFEDYLACAQNIYSSDPSLGIIGGRSFPKFLKEPPDWISEFNVLLAIRDLGETEITIQKSKFNIDKYPACSPILIAPRKKCMNEYLHFFSKNEISKNLGRKGSNLSSGEDNDINMYIFLKGYKLGYFPNLKFYHIIPEFRLTKKYLAKMAYESSRSWVKMLSNHNIRPWIPISRKTVWMRQLKAFFKQKAWLSKPNYIRWKGACGTYKGLSEL